MTRLAVVLAFACGCYHPSAETGQPCADNGACPDGQRCDLSQSPPVCVTGAGGGGSDAGLGGDGSGGGARDGAIGRDGPAVGGSGCRGDLECVSGACEESTGSCVDETTVVFVSAAGDGSGLGTRGDPVASITAALALTTASRSFIAVEPGTYTENVAATTAIAISGPGSGGTATLAGEVLVEGNAPTLLVESMAVTTTSGNCVDFETSTTIGTLFGDIIGPCEADGVQVRGGLTARNVTVTGAGNNGFNLESSSGTVDIEQSVVSGARTGVTVKQGVATIRNVLISGSTQQGIELQGGPGGGGGGGASAVIDFVTVVGTANVGSRRAIQCQMAGAGVPVVTNSLFANNGTAPEVDSNCAVSFSLWDDTSTVLTGSNDLADMTPAFDAAATGDFHLSIGSPGIDGGDPTSTVHVDLDGTPRPLGAGFDCGAFESH